MTSVLNAVVASHNSASFSVTIGNASTQYGFNTNEAIGSVSPSTFKGNTLYGIASDVSFDFGIVILGTGIPQAFFRSVVVQSTAGTIRSYASSAATFSSGVGIGGNQSQWLWGTGSSKVWTATSPSPRALILQY